MKGSGDLERRVIKTAVDWSSAGLKLELLLAGRFTYRSLEEWRQRIASGEITLNGNVVPPETLLKLHDVIEYHPADVVEPEADLNYRIVWDDGDLLVIDKPGNLCVHPSGVFFKHTLWHLLSCRFGEIHLVNRLDRETSGLLLAARRAASAAKLSDRKHPVTKRYLALVHGNFSRPLAARGFLVADTASLVHKKRRFVPGDRPPPDALEIESCCTMLAPVRPGREFSLVAAELATGRMHQIRATLCSLGYPLVGDKLYGVDERIFLKIRRNAITPEDQARLLLPRQALHASELAFRHPADGRELHFSSPWPDNLAPALDWIGD